MYKLKPKFWFYFAVYTIAMGVACLYTVLTVVVLGGFFWLLIRTTPFQNSKQICCSLALKQDEIVSANFTIMHIENHIASPPSATHDNDLGGPLHGVHPCMPTKERIHTFNLWNRPWSGPTVSPAASCCCL